MLVPKKGIFFAGLTTVTLFQAMVIYLWIMAVGYLTFGTAAEGLILNNYSEQVREEKNYGGLRGVKKNALPETNSEFTPENGWLGDVFPTEIVPF